MEATCALSLGLMHPERMDYVLVDPPLRELLRSINSSSWARTISSCAGPAHHDGGGTMYLTLEVSGISGIGRLLKWLSLSGTLGLNDCMEGSEFKAFALPDIELLHPGTLMGKGWVRVELRSVIGASPLSLQEARGCIKALWLGWKELSSSLGHWSEKLGHRPTMDIIVSRWSHPEAL